MPVPQTGATGPSLAQLPPPSSLLDFPSGQSIYNAEEPAYGVFLIDRGMVEVTKPASGGHDFVLDIYVPGEIFDESARALACTSVRFWTADEISGAVSNCPSLALALSKILIARTRTLRERLASIDGDGDARRLARTLLRFESRMGRPSANGWSVLPALTDDILARYTRSTVKAIGRDLAFFRKQGCARACGQGIGVNVRALEEWIGDPA
jgi:CRP-like cAMP-binding protein